MGSKPGRRDDCENTLKWAGGRVTKVKGGGFFSVSMLLSINIVMHNAELERSGWQTCIPLT